MEIIVPLNTPFTSAGPCPFLAFLHWLGFQDRLNQGLGAASPVAPDYRQSFPSLTTNNGISNWSYVHVAF